MTLFFVEKKSITEIEKIIAVSRKSISLFLKRHPEYEREMAQRKKENHKKRKEYQREWDRKNRSGRYSAINAATLRMEHDMAAYVLSREKF